MYGAPWQNDVLKRTDRRELPVGCVSRSMSGHELRIHGLLAGQWEQGLDRALLAQAWVFVDVTSSFYSIRRGRHDAFEALGREWGDLVVELPLQLVSGDHRVRVAVTVALPETHSNGGSIVARSPDFVAVDGPKGAGGRQSILPVRPSVSVPGLCRLVIEDLEGPVLEISNRLQGVNCKDVARQPFFKFGVLESCVRQVFMHIACRRESVGPWAQVWLQVPGVKGRDLPELEGQDFEAAYRAAASWAAECTEACMVKLEVADLFAKAAKAGEGEG